MKNTEIRSLYNSIAENILKAGFEASGIEAEKVGNSWFVKMQTAGAPEVWIEFATVTKQWFATKTNPAFNIDALKQKIADHKAKVEAGKEWRKAEALARKANK